MAFSYGNYTTLFSQLQKSLKISGKGVKKDGSGVEGVVEEGGVAGSTKEKLKNGFSFKSST